MASAGRLDADFVVGNDFRVVQFTPPRLAVLDSKQATTIRARVPLDVLRDTIQPFPTFSEIYVAALKALHGQVASK